MLFLGVRFRHAVAALPILLGLCAAARSADPTIVSVDDRRGPNARAARTDRYANDPPRLILRRGAQYDIRVTCSPDFNISQHEVSFRITHTFDGAAATITIPENFTLPAGQWSCKPASIDATGVNPVAKMTVAVPANAPVGEYGVLQAVLRRRSDNAPLSTRNFPLSTVILFNTWSEADAVALVTDNAKREYVLNQNTRIWRGDLQADGSQGASVAPLDWALEQFSNRSVLNAALLLLSPLTSAERANPVRVSDHLAQRIGDDVIEGRWEATFPGADRDPLDWTTSGQVLQVYLDKLADAGIPDKHVKYGQCWVFAGVTVSTFRALGLPARPTTCFRSGIHINGNLTDYRVNRHYRVVAGAWRLAPAQPNDSYWNYHVWTDAWMTRPDRADPNPGAQDGFQATDATESAALNINPTGPAPIPAIRSRGGGLYNTNDFSYAVSANYRELYRPPAGPEVAYAYPNFTGRVIVTKQIGTDAQRDIRAQYRQDFEPPPPGGSPSNISVVLTEPDGIAGHGQTWGATATNVGSAPATVTLTLRVDLASYIGTALADFTYGEQTATLLPGQSLSISSTATPSQYVGWGPGIDTTQALAVAEVVGTGEVFGATERAQLVYPTPAVTVTPTFVLPGAALSGSVSWTNPLPVPLADATLEIQCSGNAHLSTGGQSVIVPLGSVGPGATVNHVVALAADFRGDGALSAVVSAAEINGLSGPGSAAFKVFPCVADYNFDGSVDDFDFFDFLNDFFNPGPAADITDDDAVDDDDYFEFLNQFFGGC